MCARARGYVSVHGCVNTCISVSACARPLAAGKKPEDIYPGGEIRLSFWPRAFPRLLQRVTEGDGKFFQAAGAAARQLHVAQAGGTVAPGWGSRGQRWPGLGAAAWGRSSGGRSGAPCGGERPSPGCLAPRVARRGGGVSSAELGAPQGRVTRRWRLAAAAVRVRSVPDAAGSIQGRGLQFSGRALGQDALHLRLHN